MILRLSSRRPKKPGVYICRRWPPLNPNKKYYHDELVEITKEAGGIFWFSGYITSVPLKRIERKAKWSGPLELI